MKVSSCIGFLAALTVLATGASTHKWKKPRYCQDKDCPVFRLVDTKEVYEVREYEAAEYACTTVTGLIYTLAETKAFTQLFRYFSGANTDRRVNKQKLAMTTPVVTVLQPTENYQSAANNFTMGFYIPYKFQGKAPEPTLDDVTVVRAPAVTTYVASFGGFATEGTVLAEAAKLRDALRADKVDINEKVFWSASYNGPTQLTDRHNEVGFDVLSRDAVPSSGTAAVLRAMRKRLAHFMTILGM